MIEEVNDINNLQLSPNLTKLEDKVSFDAFSKLLVYKENELVIAYLYYSDIYDRAEINYIEVDKDYRNKKIGSKLMEYLINKLNKSISLEVSEKNTYARKLYKKFDFKECAIRKNYYPDSDGILMVRD